MSFKPFADKIVNVPPKKLHQQYKKYDEEDKEERTKKRS